MILKYQNNKPKNKKRNVKCFTNTISSCSHNISIPVLTLATRSCMGCESEYHTMICVRSDHTKVQCVFCVYTTHFTDSKVQVVHPLHTRGADVKIKSYCIMVFREPSHNCHEILLHFSSLYTCTAMY
jgi:predicted MarR family transcription regulator